MAAESSAFEGHLQQCSGAALAPNLSQAALTSLHADVWFHDFSFPQSRSQKTKPLAGLMESWLAQITSGTGAPSSIQVNGQACSIAGLPPSPPPPPASGGVEGITAGGHCTRDWDQYVTWYCWFRCWVYVWCSSMQRWFDISKTWGSAPLAPPPPASGGVEGITAGGHCERARGPHTPHTACHMVLMLLVIS